MDKRRQGYGGRVMFTLFLVSMLAPLSLSVRAGETQIPAAVTEERVRDLPQRRGAEAVCDAAALLQDTEGLPGNAGRSGIKGPAGSGGDPETGEQPGTEGMMEDPATDSMQGEGSAQIPGIIFVGDSRFVQMHDAAGRNPYVWIAKVSQGYRWFSEEAIPQIDEAVGSGTKVVLNLGVNDTENADAYIRTVNGKAAEWMSEGAQVYYASVNPVRDGRFVTEKGVERFNEKLRAGLDAQIRWIDSHSWLMETGYTLTDGLHFDSVTSERLYQYYLAALEEG